MSSRVHEAVKAIALCHNVTPVYESNGVTDQAEAEKQFEDSCRVYQASSPDEVTRGGRGHTFIPGLQQGSVMVLCGPNCPHSRPCLDSLPPAHKTWHLILETGFVLFLFWDSVSRSLG